MTIKFLLDTNVVSEPLRAKPNRAVVRQLEQQEGQSAIPSPVWHELLVGYYRLPPSQKRRAIEEYLNELDFPILAYDATAAKWHAAERARLSKIGKTPSFVDGQIAAICHVHNLTLVTFNMSDFSNYDGLSFTDWRL